MIQYPSEKESPKTSRGLLSGEAAGVLGNSKGIHHIVGQWYLPLPALRRATNRKIP